MIGEKRFRTRVLVAVVLVLAAGWGLSAAQLKNRVELDAGLSYPLLSRLFEMEQTSAINVQLGYRVSERFSLGLVYETMSTNTDINDLECAPSVPTRQFGSGLVGCQGKSDLDLYGLSGTFVISGDPDFQLLGILSAGQGKMDLTPPANVSRPLTDTDISLWYEVGAGARWARGDHWLLRFTLTVRQIKPKDPNLVLTTARTAIVPSLNIGFRF